MGHALYRPACSPLLPSGVHRRRLRPPAYTISPAPCSYHNPSCLAIGGDKRNPACAPRDVPGWEQGGAARPAGCRGDVRPAGLEHACRHPLRPEFWTLAVRAGWQPVKRRHFLMMHRDLFEGQPKFQSPWTPLCCLGRGRQPVAELGAGKLSESHISARQRPQDGAMKWQLGPWPSVSPPGRPAVSALQLRSSP